MRKRILSILMIPIILLLSVPARGDAALTNAPLLESAPITLACAGAILVEVESGQIIFAKNADEKRPVASITKVMTILLCLEAIEQDRASLDDPVRISKNASGMGGSQVLLDTGETQPLSALLKSAIIASANDASVAIAEHLYGSEELFVTQMNRRAEELGLQNTHFVNCTGLPAAGQYTTARDVAIMSMRMFEHDLYYRYSTIWMDELDHGDGRVTQLTNTNRLIRLYDGCDGGKTGSTNEAGYCVSATARRGGMRLLAVVLGAASGSARFDAAEDMFAYGFANYRIYTVVEKGARVKGDMPVTGGQTDSVKLMIDGEMTILMNKAETADIHLTPNLPPSLSAPVRQGDPAGSVDVTVNGRTVNQIPVVAAADVPRRTFPDAWLRAWDRWLYSQ